MKIAILSESSADGSAIRILIDSVIGARTLDVEMPTTLQVRGWPAVRGVLRPVIQYLHYKTDAEGLVVVVDSNHSPFLPNNTHSRSQELQQIAQDTVSILRPVHARPILRVAVGVACPAIEAWLLSHRRSNVNEMEWRRGLETKQYPYSKLDLKKYLYHVERPSLILETEKMIEAAKELSTQPHQLEAQFPVGFGMLAAELRSWLRVGG